MNSDDFLNYYNLIDKFLRKENGLGQDVSFTQKIKNSSNKAVKRFKDELISFGELRNAIVHNPRINNKVIAEPHDETVKRITELYKSISNPTKVTPTFQFKILGAHEDDHIDKILREMKEKSISQFPVFNQENRVVEIINTNTISRWLSAQLGEEGTIIVEPVKVKDLIPSIEFRQNYQFISKTASIYEAYDLFIVNINTKKRNLDLLFITDSGSPTESLLGLVTIEDIASLLEN